MKKKLTYAVMALFCLAMVACTPSNDSLLDQYEKACKKGDRVEALKIMEKLDENELTMEQLERFHKITLEANF